MAGSRWVLAGVASSVIAGCTWLPEYRDDPLSTADVIRHIKCEMRDAVWLNPENKWIRPWTAGLIFEFEVTHAGGLETETSWSFPLNQGANFVIALTGGVSGNATRTERMNFKVPLWTNDVKLDCFKGEPGKHRLLGGKLGIDDILERARLTMSEARVQAYTQLDYNLSFVIKKNAGVTPRFSLIPIGKEKTFTGQLKWTGSYSDTQSVKITLTPPSDGCDFVDDHGCPSPMFTVVPRIKPCEKFKTKLGCEDNGCRWVVHPDLDKCEGTPVSRARRQDAVPSSRAAPGIPGIRRGISRADEEKNTSAQRGNTIDSIESELRRQRIGN